MTEYYYWEDINTFALEDFEGWSGFSFNVSADLGLSVGKGFSFTKNKLDGYLIGKTTSIGVGVGPTVINGYVGTGYTKNIKHGKKDKTIHRTNEAK